MPKGNDAASAPANQIFQYEVRLLGIDEVNQEHLSAAHQNRYNVGDHLCIRHPSRRCDVKRLLGTVTKVVSAQKVEVDGMPRHVRDLRLATTPPPPLTGNFLAMEKQNVATENDELPIVISFPRRAPEESDDQPSDDDNGLGRPLPRRGSRERRPTRPFQYSDLLQDQRGV